MKNRFGFALLFLLGFTLGLVLLTGDARAQQPAPTSATAKQSSANPDSGPYTVISSIEVGVRGIAIDGNADKYRSDLNYTPGFRLLDSSLLMKSKDGDGLAFDTLSVSSFGWGIGGGSHRGNDPNRALRVNAEKGNAYRFDANYRRFDYFNNLRNFSLNQHTSNTEYRQGDFDLTLLPKNEKLRVNLGYSLNRNSGPSVLTYDYSRDEFPVIARHRAEIVPGLGFLPTAIVDQHFIRRERHNRLLSAVLERPSLLGVGIDESTALEVGPDGRWRVLGRSAVVIYDARRAHVTDGEKPLLGATEVRVHVLPAGSVFDPETGGGEL